MFSRSMSSAVHRPCPNFFAFLLISLRSNIASARSGYCILPRQPREIRGDSRGAGGAFAPTGAPSLYMGWAGWTSPAALRASNHPIFGTFSRLITWMGITVSRLEKILDLLLMFSTPDGRLSYGLAGREARPKSRGRHQEKRIEIGTSPKRPSENTGVAWLRNPPNPRHLLPPPPAAATATRPRPSRTPRGSCRATSWW